MEYFAGYRKHTLIAIDPKTGQNYPLFSLVAPGNHHDNQFTPLILAFSRAMGLEIKLSTADEDYADAEQNEAIKREYEVTVIIPPDKQAKIPEDVDSKTLMNLLLYLTIFASHASYCRSFHIF